MSSHDIVILDSNHDNFNFRHDTYINGLHAGISLAVVVEHLLPVAQ